MTYTAGRSVNPKTALNDRQLQQDQSTGQQRLVYLDLDYAEARDVAEDAASMIPSNQERNATLVKAYHGEYVPSSGHNAAWFGLKSGERIQDLFDNGWPEGLERIHQLAAEVERMLPPPVDVRRRPLWLDEGDELDRDRLMSGQIDQMWRVAKRARGRTPRAVKLVVEIGGNAHLAADQMFWAGASAVATATLLEQAGYRCEIIAASASTGHQDGARLVMAYRVKETREPLREDIVAFACAHAGFFRLFALIGAGHLPVTLGYYHGQAVSLKPYWDDLVKRGLAQPADFFFSAQRDQKDAVATVKKALLTITGDAHLFGPDPQKTGTK